MLPKNFTVGVNSFAGGYKLQNGRSQFNGSNEELIQCIHRGILAGNVEKGVTEGSVIVTFVSEDVSKVLTPYVTLAQGDIIIQEFSPRCSNPSESPRKSAGRVIKNGGVATTVSKFSRAILYSSTQLAKEGANELSDLPENFEVCVIEGYEENPGDVIHPDTLLHNLCFGTSEEHGTTEVALSRDEVEVALQRGFTHYRDKCALASTKFKQTTIQKIFNTLGNTDRENLLVLLSQAHETSKTLIPATT